MPPIGFIQDELDLKLLVLYIMSRTAGPITFFQLLELALCDAGVDYFSLTQAVEHMVATGQLSKEGDRYSITERGKRNSQICESSLPYSVRMHCDENLIQVNRALRLEARVRTQVEDNADGPAILHVALDDDTDSPLLRLDLLAPNHDRAKAWADTYRTDPSALYLGITNLLDSLGQKKEDSK